MLRVKELETFILLKGITSTNKAIIYLIKIINADILSWCNVWFIKKTLKYLLLFFQREFSLQI